MEQLSFIKDTLEERIKKQMIKAVNKGILPGTIVTFDDNEKDRNIVLGLYLGNENKIEARLMSESSNCYMSYPVLSERLNVIGFYEKLGE